MNTKLLKTIYVSLAFGAFLTLSACEEYLDIVPKGQKSPTTFADYEAFLADDYIQMSVFDMPEVITLTNERFMSNTALKQNSIDAINYNWNESADRVAMTSSTLPYNGNYKGIETFNIIIEKVGEVKDATDEQKQELIAQAKVLRAMTYFFLVNKYAPAYTDDATAASTRAIVINTGINMEDPLPQASVKEVYDQMEKDLLDAVNTGLPKDVNFGYKPKAGAAHAMLARIYLFSKKYDEAFKYADLALKENSQLDDWIKIYNDNLATITSEPMLGAFVMAYTPGVTLHSRENYVYRQTLSTNYDITVDRAAKFETGDIRLLAKYKLAKEAYGSTVDVYKLFFRDPNPGPGIRTPEMYYIKAECYARQGKLQEALDQLNLVRVTRFLPTEYAPLTVTAGMTQKDVIDLVRRERSNEYIAQGMEYLDMRRFNTEAEHKRTLTGTDVYGNPKQLTPESHLWIQPFPPSSIMLNKDIKQNTK